MLIRALYHHFYLGDTEKVLQDVDDFNSAYETASKIEPLEFHSFIFSKMQNGLMQLVR